MFLVLSAAIFGIIILLYLVFAKWSQQYWRKRGVPQLSPDLLFGDMKPLLLGKLSVKDAFLNIYQSAKKAGYKHIGIYGAISPQYMPIDLELSKRMLTKDFFNFSSHGTFYHKDVPLTSHLFSIEGAEWKVRRAKLTPVFTSGKMKMMFETVAQTSNRLTQVVDGMVESNKPIDIKEICARFTTDVIASVAFGLETNSLDDPEHLFRKIGRTVFKPRLLQFAVSSFLPHNVIAWLGIKMIPEEATTYFSRIVKETISYREQSGFERKDFMQLMLQLKAKGSLSSDDGRPLLQNIKHFVNDEEILNESFLFFLAGFETSSSTMSFALLELSQHLDVQDKLHDEIVEILTKHNGHITYDSLMQMEYLDRVLKETLRKYPVVPVLPRKCTEDYTVPGTNIVIEKGTRVHIPVIGIHMDTDYYDQPEQFNPDNFLPENVARRPDFAWLPFGEGPRHCIGLRFGVMQAKIGLVALLAKFRYTLHESTQPPFEADAGTTIYMFKKNVLLVGSKIPNVDLKLSE